MQSSSTARKKLVPNNSWSPTWMSTLTHPLQHISGKNHDRRLDKASTAYGMEISAEKTKLMTNNTSGINTEIKVNGQLMLLSYASSSLAQL